MKLPLLFSIFLFLSPSFAFPQKHINDKPPIDSLELAIDNQTGQEKLKSIVEFCEHFCVGSPIKTIEYADLGIELAKPLKKETAIAVLYRQKGCSLIVTGNLEEGLGYIKNALGISSQLKDSIGIGRSYYALAHYHYIKGDYEIARGKYELAVNISEKIKDHKTTYGAKKNIANTYCLQRDYIRALEIYDKLLLYCGEYTIDCAGTILNKALALHNVGKPSEALKLFFEAKKSFELKGDRGGVVSAEHHIGFLLHKIGLHQEALKYYFSVHKFYSENGDVNLLSHINLNLGETMLELGDIESAEKYIKESIRLKQEKGIKNLIDHYFLLGDVFLAKKNFDQALKYYKLSYKTAVELEDISGEADTFNSLSRFYFQTSAYSKAESYAEKALRENEKLQNQSGIAWSYENLINAYEKQEKFALALQAKNKLDSINLALKGPKELLKITKQVVLETLRENEKIEEEESKVGWGYYYLLLPVLLLIGAGAYLLLKSKKGKPVNNNYLTKKEGKHLLKNLEDVMQSQKPYLNPELTLRDLATLIQTTDKKLSALLNQHSATNFYDYINQFRIEAFKEKIKVGANNNFSMAGLASECGFKSKSSFYRAFKKHVGVSPSEYKDFLKKTFGRY